MTLVQVMAELEEQVLAVTEQEVTEVALLLIR